MPFELSRKGVPMHCGKIMDYNGDHASCADPGCIYSADMESIFWARREWIWEQQELGRWPGVGNDA